MNCLYWHTDCNWAWLAIEYKEKNVSSWNKKNMSVTSWPDNCNFQDKISTLTCTNTRSLSVLIHIVFLSLSVYITDPSPKESSLKQWNIFLSAPLSYIHPHCTYLARFIFKSIWWILVEKLRNASEKSSAFAIHSSSESNTYIRWEAVTQTVSRNKI